jgi:hypothetical protein
LPAALPSSCVNGLTRTPRNHVYPAALGRALTAIGHILIQVAPI